MTPFERLDRCCPQCERKSYLFRARKTVEVAEAVIERNASIYRERLPSARVGIIPRVGFDVAASCGMFFGPESPQSA